MDYIFFTDNWWNWFLHEYAFSLLILYALLRCIAVLDPSNKTNLIIDTFRNVISKRSGKEMARRESDKHDANPS